MMPVYPEKLQRLLELFESIPDRELRGDMLIDYAARFRGVPERIARRPYPERNRVPECESEAYVWGEEHRDGTMKLHIAVENPQGVSAKAMSVILDETLSGLPPEQVVQVSSEIVYKIFGREVTMGKGIGLMGLVNMVQAAAKNILASRAAKN